MSSCLPRGAWVAPLRFIALKLAPPQVSGFHTNINTCLKKSSAMLKHTSCKYNAMPAQLTDNWFFTILGISYTLNAQTTGKKKHQPLGFSILKFQSSHPPPKINKSNIKSKVRWFSPYPRGNPPQKKHHSSAHLLCLWKSAWKGPFPQQKSRWTKRGSNEKKTTIVIHCQITGNKKIQWLVFVDFNLLIYFLFQIKILIGIHSALGEKLILDLAIGYALYLPPRMLARQRHQDCQFGLLHFS